MAAAEFLHLISHRIFRPNTVRLALDSPYVQ